MCSTMNGLSEYTILRCSVFVSGLNFMLVLLCGTAFLASSAHNQRVPEANAKSKLDRDERYPADDLSWHSADRCPHGQGNWPVALH